MVALQASESVRSRCDDNEEDDGNSTLCQAAPVFALCRFPLHHTLNERFQASGPAALNAPVVVAFEHGTASGGAVIPTNNS